MSPTRLRIINTKFPSLKAVGTKLSWFLYKDKVFTDQDLKGFDFEETKFVDCKLNWINFKDTSLAGCLFQHCRLEGCSFEKQKLPAK